MSNLITIKNNNARIGHWLGKPSNTFITGEKNRSYEYDIGYLKHLIRNDCMVPFYQSPLWNITRLEVLTRDNYECQRCKYNKTLTTYHPDDKKHSMYVHHICEIKKYPQHCLNQAILVTLCWMCHETVHGRIFIPKVDHFANFNSDEII